MTDTPGLSAEQFPPLGDAEIRDIVATAVALISCVSDGLFSTIALLPISGDRKGVETCHVVIDPCRVAVRGEVLRVYDRRGDCLSDRSQCSDLLLRELLPRIVGRGEYKIVWEELTECWVILPGDPNDDSTCHDLVSSSNVES